MTVSATIAGVGLVVRRLGLCAVLAAAAVGVAPADVVAQSGSGEPVYADVAADAYYSEPVESLAAMGVFEGTECEEGFCPDDPLLRREMAVWLIRALGEDSELSDQVSRFVDVEDGDWHMPYIERMADLEITVGCRKDPPRFCPDRAVRRDQMASFLARAFDLPAAPFAGFADVDRETNDHAQNIDRLAATEITVGCRKDPLRYCPERSTRRAHMAAFIYRALEWRQERAVSRVVEDRNPGVFLTEENDLSRVVRHEIVDKHADEHPWLMEVWNYTNSPDFDYHIDEENAGSQVHYGLVPRTEDTPLWGIRAVKLQTGDYKVNDSFFWQTLVHEMAHVYTNATDGASSYPAAVAIGHLYFEHLAAESGCAAHELYADAAKKSVDLQTGHPVWYWYWGLCEGLPDEPTSEAVGVVRQSFVGERPQWFYDTFQMTDGRLDYRAIWAAVKEARIYNRYSIVYQLKDEFGGYCSDREAHQSAFGDSNLEQPWRDGGCS